MAAILTLRSVKGTPLTNNEVDTNFTNLNSEISSIETSINTINSNISTINGDIDDLELAIAECTLTIDGDASGSATITNLANTTITLDVSNISGNLTVTGDVSAANFNSTSDVSLKENLNIIDYPLEKLSQLNGYTFDWKSSKKSAIGIVAQEVEKVFPQMVVTGEDGVKRVSYDSLIPVLLEAIKELNSKIK